MISYSYDQVVATLKAGCANYSPNGQIFLVQMGAKDSKIAATCNFSMCPAGPARRRDAWLGHSDRLEEKGRGLAILITWAMSKPIVRQMVVERGYSSITRRSLIDSPEF